MTDVATILRGPSERIFAKKTDGYKPSHWLFYEPGISQTYDYLTSRGGQFQTLIPFGFQGFAMKYLCGRVITPEQVKRAKKFYARYYGMDGVFNYDGWMYIAEKLDGRLPLELWALPEGLSKKSKNRNQTGVPVQTPLMAYFNTDPNCAWLPGYIEPLMFKTWNPITVATLSQHCKIVLYEGLKRTGTPADIIWKLHDFGYRGVSSEESAEIAGAAHLVNFWGTDTVPSLDYVNEFYSDGVVDEDGDPTYMPGYSVRATEHSVMTQRGRALEVEVVRDILKKCPTGIIAMVADSYNLWDFAEKILGTTLHTEVVEREGIVVVRPDCYDEQTEILTENGFLSFSELMDNQKIRVAQYHENGTVDFVFPTKYFQDVYEGPMQYFTNEHHIDLLVTPNHRMIRRNAAKRIDVQKAENVKYNFRWQHIHAGTLIGDRKLSPLERILIAFQADGSYNTTGPKNKIRFTFTKQRKIQRMTELCDNAGIDYHTTTEPGRPQNTQFYITLDEAPLKNFEWVLPILSQISGLWAQEFIEEMSYWDATRRSDDRFKFDTTVAINAEVVQTLATLAGYRTCYSISPDTRKEIFSDVHTVHVCLWDYSDGQSIKCEQVQYNGTIYCVQVPTGMLIVRRNGKVSVCGNSGEPIPTMMKLLWILGEKFGWTVNQKGYRVLNHVRTLQGDKNDYDAIYNMIAATEGAKWSLDNIATFGMGGALLQASTRDTQKMAVKLSSLTDSEGKWRDVYKDPITDPGKGSKWGRFAVTLEHDEDTGEDRFVTTVLKQGQPNPEGNLLRPIYRNGEMLIHESFETVRARANAWMA